MDVKQKVYEFVVQEVRTYVVQGDGTSEFGAQQDAIERFHRLQKSGELVAKTVGKPKIIKTLK